MEVSRRVFLGSVGAGVLAPPAVALAPRPSSSSSSSTTVPGAEDDIYIPELLILGNQFPLLDAINRAFMEPGVKYRPWRGVFRAWTGWKGHNASSVLCAQWLIFENLGPNSRGGFDVGRRIYAATPGDAGEYNRGETFNLIWPEGLPALDLDSLTIAWDSDPEAVRRLCAEVKLDCWRRCKQAARAAGLL